MLGATTRNTRGILRRSNDADDPAPPPNRRGEVVGCALVVLGALVVAARAVLRVDAAVFVAVLEGVNREVRDPARRVFVGEAAELVFVLLQLLFVEQAL